MKTYMILIIFIKATLLLSRKKLFLASVKSNQRQKNSRSMLQTQAPLCLKDLSKNEQSVTYLCCTKSNKDFHISSKGQLKGVLYDG